jgi:hypothetical protein
MLLINSTLTLFAFNVAARPFPRHHRRRQCYRDCGLPVFVGPLVVSEDIIIRPCAPCASPRIRAGEVPFPTAMLAFALRAWRERAKPLRA